MTRLSRDDLFDALEEARPVLRGEYLGGGIDALIAQGGDGVIVITDDYDAILVGFYPGDTWDSGEQDGVVLADVAPTDLEAILAAIDQALTLIGEVA